MGDAFAERGDGFVLQREVGVEDFLHRLADPEPADVLEVRQAFEEQDAFDERVGMAHLVYGFLVFVLRRAFAIPQFPEHPRMQEILVDRRQLVFQNIVENCDDFPVALHNSLQFPS